MSDTIVFTVAKESDSDFSINLDKYYLANFDYPNKQGFLPSYRSSHNRVVRYQFNFGPLSKNKEELINGRYASLRSGTEMTLGV